MKKYKLTIIILITLITLVSAYAGRRAFSVYYYHPNFNPAIYATIGSEVECQVLDIGCEIPIAGQGVKQLYIREDETGIYYPVRPQ